MSDRPTPETKEAWDAVSRLPSGMYDSRVSILAYATAMSDHSRKMERQRDEWHGAFLLATKRAGDAGELLVGLKRQRDGLLEAIYAIDERFIDGCDTYDDWQFMGQTARAAIAAAKGGEV